MTHNTRRARIWWELAIVLGLSLGASAVYSIVQITARLTADTPLADQSAGLNQSQSSREWLDFTYQFLGVFFDLFAVALALYLLWTPRLSGFRRIGFEFSRPAPDLNRGLLLFLVIGIPGIVFYVIGRAIGITVAVVPAPLDAHWWTIPVLILSALRASLLEEVIAVGYLFTRLAELGWSKWSIIVSSALLRATYHLYQGIGPFFGNFAMGILFGWFYSRYGRVMPLVVTHLLLDIVSFVGYPLALMWWPEFFAPPGS